MLVISCLALIALQGFLVQSESILPEAINHAIVSSFCETADVLHVVIETDFEENTESFLDAIDDISVENWTFRIQIDVNNKDGRAVSNHNLWFIDTYAAFRRLLQWIRGYHKDTQLFYFIVLNNSQSDEPLNVIQNIFSDLLMLMIGNVNVIIESASGEVLFYTFYPYQEMECLSAKPFIAHRFINNSIRPTKHFFPPKGDNFRGCPLRIKTRNELILTLGNYELPNNLVNYDMSRLELTIVMEFAYRMNSTFKIKNVTELTPVLPNETVDVTTLPYKLMSDDKTDLVLGFYKYDSTENHFLSKSVPYYFTWMSIFLNNQANTLRTQAWLFVPFNTTTWIYIFVSLILITGCIILARQTKRLGGIFNFQYRRLGGLEIVSVVIGAPVEHLSTNNSLRFLFIVLSFCTLILRTAYHGKLYDAYRGGTMIKPPKSLSELFAENYTVYTVYQSIINDLKNDKGFEYLNISKLKGVVEDVKLFETDRKIALVVSYVYIYTFYTAQQRKKLMMHNILVEQICMYFQQHSIIQPKANEIIMKMEEAGILHHLRRNYENTNDGEFYMDENDKEPQPLVLERFAFTFYLWGVLCAISCLVFAAELLCHKLKQMFGRIASV